MNPTYARHHFTELAPDTGAPALSSDVIVLTHTSARASLIVLNRPHTRNAWRTATLNDLVTALGFIRRHDATDAVLLTGASQLGTPEAFSSGGDHTEPAPLESVLHLQQTLRFFPKPTVAVVNGWAVSGGFTLQLLCDLAIASKEYAKFKHTYASIGAFDAGYGPAHLARVVGYRKAREMFLLGQTYSADEMFRIGAINEVVAHDDLIPRAIELGRIISKGSASAHRALKYAALAQDEGMLGQQLIAGEVASVTADSSDAREGRSAFLEKRQPNWEEIK